MSDDRGLILTLVCILLVCLVTMFSRDPSVTVVGALFAFVAAVGLVIALRRGLV